MADASPSCVVCAAATASAPHNAQSDAAHGAADTIGSDRNGSAPLQETPLSYQRTSQLKIFLSCTTEPTRVYLLERRF
jgi:hypothetical protein